MPAPIVGPPTWVVPIANAILSGTWQGPTGSGYGGEGVDYAPAGSGSVTATWIFAGMTPGDTYQCGLTWLEAGNRATNTPWGVYDSDGSTLLASGTIDQTAASSGPTAGGVQFSIISGNVIPTGTSLLIQITDNANGYVIADAAMAVFESAPASTAHGAGLMMGT